MADKAYEYMDWPRIEAIVYGEEASPRDVMQPRVTEDGVLIQGFFPDAEKAEVLVDKKAYEMEKQDDAGYFAAMIPGRKIPAYQYRITRGEEIRTFADPYAFPGQITEAEEKAFLEAEKEADDADINDGNDGGYDDVLPEELDAVIDAMAGGAEKSAEADDAADTLQADVEPQDIVELD